MDAPVYLDYNATALTRPEAAAAMAAALAAGGNPSSVHGFGRAARRRVEEARETVAALVGADPAAVVFTSGGTEANNLALKGSGRGRVLVSGIEHDSVLRAVPAPEVVPVTPEGRIELAALEAMLAASEAPTLVAVMLANNETGVIQPVAAAAEIAHAHGALVHCDAVQAAGKIPVDVRALGADTVALSAHKVGGPAGVGALVLVRDVALAPALTGGGQERGRRGGTENLAGIVGFGAAAGLAAAELDRYARLAGLRDGLERRIRELAPGVRVFGADAPRLPNTSCLAMPGVSGETQVMAFDLAGFAVSAGSACSSGKVTVSHVLAAMGAGEDAANAVRVSLGWASEPAHVDGFAEAWGRVYARAGAKARAAPAA